MNRDQTSFFSDLLQNLGFIATGFIAFTQYSLSGSFQFLFRGDMQLLKVSSLAALITSAAIFLGVFTIRFSLTNKIFFSKKSHEEFQKKISKENKKDQNKRLYVPEPNSFNLIQLAFAFVALGVICFLIALSTDQSTVTSISYVLFIDFAIAAMSVFSIKLYTDRDNIKRADETNEIILNKIRTYFIGDIKITYDSTDYFQFVGPNRQIIFEYNGKKYDVFTKSYDPNNYFLIQEHADIAKG